VLRDAFAGCRRFEQFQESLGIPRAVLAARLDRLVDEGLMERRRYEEHPPRYEYRLTAKGRAFWDVLAAMWRWGEDWLWEDGAEPPLSGATVRNQVQIADPALPRKSRPSDRQQIRRNAERGYAVRRIPGAAASDSDRAGFLAAYEQTMQRAGAEERYFFGDQYFATILAFEDCSLFLALEPGGEVAAGSIAARSDGMLHYYLSGSADRFLGDSPMKNVVAAIVDFADDSGLPLNLGGGINPGDPLEEFKRGFANRTEPFHTSEIVCDGEAYRQLSAGRDSGGFFPAYRS